MTITAPVPLVFSNDSLLRLQIYQDQTDNIFQSNESCPDYIGSLHRLDCAELMGSVSEFVAGTLKTDGIPILRVLTKQGEHFQMQPMAKCFYRQMPRLLKVTQHLSPHYAYDEYISAFIACAEKLGIYDAPVDWDSTCNGHHILSGLPETIHCVDIFNEFVAEIRTYCHALKIKEKRRLRLREIDRRYQDLCEYVDCLFQSWNRLIVVRVDFFYANQFSEIVSIEQAQYDLKRLLDNRRTNTLFKGMRGYIWKLEYALKKGIHFHLIFFLDGAVRQPTSHVYFAKEIGEYWVKVITEGKGDYWNVNAEAKNYERLNRRGIGEIHQADASLRQHLEAFVIGYLCKADQFVRFKFKKRLRVIARGEFPKREHRKPGPKSKRTLKIVSVRSPGLLKLCGGKQAP